MNSSPASTPQQLVDHLFRHQSGKMIAVLTSIFGMHQLQMAEDVVQEAFYKAMQVWKFDRIPENPEAWLMQTARNRAIDIIRKQQYFQQYSAELTRRLNSDTAHTVEQFFTEAEISDSQLRMIFTCCHPSLKEEDRVALTLKTISGFSVAEIARALLSNEAAVEKRLYRAKQFVKAHNIQLEIPAGDALQQRLETVYTILYLLFNEGYNSLKADELIRTDLCAEAMRLCLLLSEHKTGNRPSTFALLALMCFQASRFNSRLDENNSIILLQQQDRNTWNKELIQLGYKYLNHSSHGSQLSIYHIESAIAAEHCMAASFDQTNWQRLLQLYNLLIEYKNTPVVVLNRAVVMAQGGNIQTAINEVVCIDGIEKLLQSQYIYSAVLGDLYVRANELQKAVKMLELSLKLTSSEAERKLLRDKLDLLNLSAKN